MTYRLKKRLLHFETNGNIAEDFIAARRGKLRILRRQIRKCFYIHCAAPALCVVAALIFGTLPDIIKIAVCALASMVFAVFAVGDHEYSKPIACAVDAAMAAAAILLAVFAKGGALYIICGVLMCLGLLPLLALTALGTFKRFLENYSPLSIRRDDYTLLNEVGYYKLTSHPRAAAATAATATVAAAVEADDDLPPLPPLTSEMRELAGKVCEILLANEKKSQKNQEINNDIFSSNSQ